MIDLENLKQRPVEELRVLAAQYGIPTHHRAKAETVAALIVEHVMNQQAKKIEEATMQHKAEQPAAQPAKINTKEEVLDAIKKLTEKPAFKAQFLDDDTWHFSCNGAEESGHMSVPLRIIKMKAETVSRGARKPVKMMFDGDAIFTV